MNSDIRACSRTDRGIRDGNEDACGVWRAAGPGGIFTILAVADGLGGHPAGEMASQLALEALSQRISAGIVELHGAGSGDLQSLMENAFLYANSEVIRRSEDVPEWSGMGTTLIAAIVDPEGACVLGNIGDSRAYLIGEGIEKITRDHSKVQELVDSGLITQDSADRHPMKNIVTRIIGRREERPDVYTVQLNGSRLLLCSDGLVDGLSMEEIFSIASREPVGDACQRLVESARKRSRDNITVVMAEKSRGLPPGMP